MKQQAVVEPFLHQLDKVVAVLRGGIAQLHHHGPKPGVDLHLHGSGGHRLAVAAESQPDADMNNRATAVNNVAVKKVEVDKRICAFFIIFEV